MTDEQGLLYGIRVDPFDDAPRLVYADWLDENGQSDYASFIRVQIQLAKARRPKTICKCGTPEVDRTGRACKSCRANNEWQADNAEALTAQAKLFTDRNRRTWFPRIGSRGEYYNVVSRGFPYWLESRAVIVRSEMSEAFARYPITSVRLNDLVVLCVEANDECPAAYMLANYPPKDLFPRHLFESLPNHDDKELRRELSNRLVTTAANWSACRS